MKSTSRKLLLSLSTFLFTLVALFGATFAWFSAADQATVSTLTINVTAGENLKLLKSGTVGVDAIYATNLLSSDIQALYNLQHVATTGALNSGPTTYTYGNLYLTPLTSLDGAAFFTEQKSALYLDNTNNSYTPGTAGIFYFDVILTFQAIIPVDIHLLYDAIPLLSSIVATAPTERALAYRIAFFEGANLSLIWESDAPDVPNNSLVRASNYHSNIFTWVPDAVQNTTGARYDYLENDAKTYSKVASIASASPASPGYAYVTVRMWVEGWDILTDDDIKASVVLMNLKFIGLPL
jgi:hypothetical protein